MEILLKKNFKEMDNILQEFPIWPSFNEEQIEIISSILRGGKVNYWTGSEGKTFEKEFASYCGTRYSVAMANGTVALTSAYEAIGISPGDEIIMTPRTFIATASSAVLLGAKPVFVDIDEDSGCIDVNLVERLISKKTRAICVVHLGGWPADLNKLCKLAEAFNLKIIEDCSQAHGAKINGQSVGSFGDIATWSFCQDKIITTGGEGGMITTSDQNLWERIWSYKDHGKDYNAVFKNKHKPGFRWLHKSFGTNFRMTEMQSAIGRYQLSKLDQWISLRERNSSILARGLSDLEVLRVPLPKENIQCAWYKFYVYIKPNLLKEGWTRDRIISNLSEQGIPIFSGSCSEIYLEECFKKKGLVPKERLPVAKRLGETSLMLLVHPTLSEANMQYYLEKVYASIKDASK